MLLFLHGFLGQKEDWQPLTSQLNFPIVSIDLPGHGTAPWEEDLPLAVNRQVSKADIIVGYSAGGRLALELKNRYPNQYGKVILLSSHLGLNTAYERKQRFEKDKQWIERLTTLPLKTFLTQWYDQPLFHSLRDHPVFPEMMSRRKHQNPYALAQFLSSFSLSKTPIPPLFEETFFLYGSLDLQYATLYRRLTNVDRVFEVKNAGHAVHLENPTECATLIQRIVNEQS